MLYCILILRCLLAPSHFPPLPGGLSHSDCEYWFRLWRHDPKCQLKKTGEPTCGGWGHLSAELSVCTALKRFCRTLQSDVWPKEQHCWRSVIIWFPLYPFKMDLDEFHLVSSHSSCSVDMLFNSHVLIYIHIFFKKRVLKFSWILQPVKWCQTTYAAISEETERTCRFLWKVSYFIYESCFCIS